MEGEKTGGSGEGLKRKGNKAGEINRGKVKNEKNGRSREKKDGRGRKSAHGDCWKKTGLVRGEGVGGKEGGVNEKKNVQKTVCVSVCICLYQHLSTFLLLSVFNIYTHTDKFSHVCFCVCVFFF